MTETARLVIAVDSTQVSRAEADLNKFSSTSSVVERNVSSLGSTVKTVAAAFGAFKVGEQVADIVSLASRYDQLGVVMRTVGGNVGRSKVELEALDQALRETGISALQSRNNIIKMMSANIDLSKATELARLAQNAAVVANVNSSEAFERLIRGIQSAEKETLETMGLNVNFSQSYEKLAAQLGKNADQLTTTEKVQAGVNAALDAGKNIAGAYSASLDNAGKQLQSSTRYLEDFKLALGGSLQTEFSGAVEGYANSLKFLTENADAVSQVMRVGLYAAAGRASAALFEAARASLAGASASRAQVAEELRLAQAHAASTAAALAQARANVGLVGSIGSATVATAAHEAAQKRLAEAQAASIGLGRTALGLAGGWVGLAVTAGAVAASFIDWGDNAEEAARQSIALREETNLLTRAVQELDAAQAKQVLQRMEEPYRAAKDEARNYAAQIEYLNIQIERHPGSAKVEDWRRSLVEAEGNLSTVNEKLTEQETKMRELNARIDQNTKARADNNAALGETDEAGAKFLQQLQRQADFAGALTEVQRTNIAIEKGYAGEVSKTDKALALKNAALIDQANALKGSIKLTNDSANAYQALYDRLYPAEAAQRRYTEEVDRLKTVLKGNELADAIARLNAEMLEPGADATGPADAIEEYRKELERLEDKINPAGKAAKDFAAEQKRLREEIERTGDPTGKWTQLLQENERQFEQNTRATSEWAKWTESALERVDGAFADAWRNIGDGFSSFRDSLTNAFKQMLAELAHMAITRPIVLQIGAALGIGGGTGQAVSMLGGSAGSGGGMGIGSLLQYGQTAYSAITGVGPAALAGWQSGGLMGGIQGVGGYYGGALSGINAGAGQVIGTLLNGGGMTYAPLSYQLSSGALNGAIGGLAGIGGALYGYSQAGLKGAATGGLGAWGGATLGNILLPGIGGIIGGALGSALGGSLFGGDWQTKDAGLAFSVENGDFLGQQYEYQKKKGGLFSSNKKRTRFSALDYETAARFQSAFDATEDTVAGLFEALSLSVEEGSLDGLQLARTKISTKGKTEEEIQEAIAEWFGSAADAMTAELNKVFATGLDLDFEGMQAFVGNLQGVNEVLRYLDVGMYDASVAGGKLAEALSAAAGGLDALAANSATYYGAFFSEAEKIEDTIDSIKRAFESADVELAASREAYRAMVEDIDLTTEAGQKMFATLMALSGQAAQYFSIVEQQAAQKAAEAAALLMGTVNTAYAALQRSIAAQQREIQASASKAAGNISALTGIGNSLDAALKKLRGASDDTVRSLRAQAVMTLSSALVQARSGQSLAGVEGLQDALDTASQMDTALYGSLADFEREQGRTANLIAELEKVNGKQLSVEEKLLKQYEAQLSKLDQELLFAQAQLDALNGVDASVMSVAEAIKAMNASVVAALSLMGGDTGKNATPQNVGTLAESVYRSVLGRQADAAGLAYWQQQVASGAIRLDQLEQAIKNAARANGEIPAFARGGFHSGGLRLVGENGPELEVTGPSRIYNASQTAAMLSGGADTAAAITRLQQTVERQGDALRSIAKHTMQTARRVEYLERWDGDGLPPERAIA
ncbi:DUF4214 domain-containing protein [Stutzerimonas stutzeri]|uniref:DUF4214 domain-containing protein n=1 Tax=Stutzerimonas stutzeri TaxID=316 RepID=UPI00244D6EBF|nr:DUF4214 domain-containing protein [Stutzerimonas stutzeri]MDH0157371.1 DUF4214 domain-containing protein [Stutzerimonas stutzeri]